MNETKDDPFFGATSVYIISGSMYIVGIKFNTQSKETVSTIVSSLIEHEVQNSEKE
ncbi:MAG: hypothetical protein ACI4KH_03085 [Oscillospiraceae bacterium]